MTSYISRRVLETAVTALGVVTVVFFLIRLSGDPVLLMVPLGTSQAEVDILRSSLGFDQPVFVQYLTYLRDIVTGSFQESLIFGVSSMDIVMERVPSTALLAFTSLIVSVVVGCLLGLIAALKRGKAADTSVLVASSVGQAMPSFWVGILLILVFSVSLSWFPPVGSGSVAHLVLPTVTLAIYSIASIARMFRSSLLAAMSQDYVRTAVSKGLSRSRVLGRHIIPNALLPVITIVGLQAGTLLGGAIVTEVVFAWPGVGQLTVTSINNRDFPLVQSSVLFIAVAFVLINLLTDLFYALADPRIRLSSKGSV